MASRAAFLDKSTPRTALLLALGMAGVVGTALLFQHVGGYMPCKLCLEQRTPYYLGVPLMLLAALTAGRNRTISRAMLTAGGLLMFYGLSIAAYHAGIEWAWWPGPTDCSAVSTNVTNDAGTLLDDLNAIRPPSCDKAALRILGLSMAGWNVPASLTLMLVAFRAAWKA